MPILEKKKIFSSFKPGITLVELLLTIAIAAVLAAAIIVAINPTKRMGQARDSTRKAALGQISRALVAYYVEHQAYPDPGGLHFTLSVNPVDLTPNLDWIPGFRPDYLKTLPQDPKDGYYYGYKSPIDLQTFVLWAVLEDPNDPQVNGQPLPGRICKKTNPSPLPAPVGTSFNYCVSY